MRINNSVTWRRAQL